MHDEFGGQPPADGGGPASAAALPSGGRLASDTGAGAAASAGVQRGVQVPSIPTFGLVTGTIIAPIWKLNDAGCPESQTHPFGQGAPPTVQTLVQNPSMEVPKAQLQAPRVESLTVPTCVQASPMFLVRLAMGVVVQ
jgi:hypothetical protein